MTKTHMKGIQSPGETEKFKKELVPFLAGRMLNGLLGMMDNTAHLLQSILIKQYLQSEAYSAPLQEVIPAHNNASMPAKRLYSFLLYDISAFLIFV